MSFTDVFGPVGSFAGGLVDTAAGLFQAERNQDFAQKQMMNAYQWQVADLKKAGLNPMLALTKGAVMPSGSSSVSSRMGEAISGGLSLSIQRRQMESNVALNSAAAAKAAAEATEPMFRNAERLAAIGKLDADTALARADASYRLAQTQLVPLQGDLLKAQAQVQEAMIPQIRAQTLQALSSASERESAAALNRVEAILAGANAHQVQALTPYLVQLRQASAELAENGLPESRNAAAYANSRFGQIMQRYVDPVLKSVGTAVGIGRDVAIGGLAGKKALEGAPPVSPSFKPWGEGVEP